MSRVLITIIFLFTIISAFISINKIKNNKINEFIQTTYLKNVNKAEQSLKDLIDEKQQMTLSIAVSLINNDSIINVFKTGQNNLNLNSISMNLKNNTNFKNVWLQLISKDGISITRSWTDKKGDNVTNSRLDIKALLKNPKPLTTISVGKFDLSFKSIFPIYDQDKKFLGLFEVITHFNSIAKKLEKDGIQSLILADKSYKSQLADPFTKSFIGDYYISILDVDTKIIKYIQQNDLENILNQLKKNRYIIDHKNNYLINYYSILDNEKKPMAHFILFQNLTGIDKTEMDNINYIFNLYILLTLSFISLVFYFIYTTKTPHHDNKKLTKLSFLLFIIFILLFISFYKIMNAKYENDINFYKQTMLNQASLEYKSLISLYQKFAYITYDSILNTNEIKTIFKSGDRNKLYNTLLPHYNKLEQEYNLQQIHFHTKDSTSFLRMSKFARYGDNIKDVRESVEYVNRTLKPFFGFEDGKTFNGFRFVYPLFDNDSKLLGSVEISFDLSAFLNNYKELFGADNVTILLNKAILDKKILPSEKNNYLQSQFQNFYIDKSSLSAFDNEHIIKYSKYSTSELDYINFKILKTKPFIFYNSRMRTLTTYYPLINKISHFVVGAIAIEENDKYIYDRYKEFNTLIIVFIVISSFIMLFIYRELISKFKLEQTTKEQNDLLALFDKGDICLFKWNNDDNWSVSYVSSNVHKLLGYTKKEFLSNKILYSDIIHKDDAQEVFNDIQYAFQKNNDFFTHKPYRIITKDKQIKYILDSTLVIKDSNGNINHFLGYLSDITPLKNMENELIESSKMSSLTELISNIAHQWRQPLSLISTVSSGMQLEHEYGLLTDEKIIEHTATITNTAEYLSQIINSFSELLDSKQDKQEVVVQEVIIKTLDILKLTLKDNNIELINEVDTKMPLIKKISASNLSQVITHIINNAKDILLERKIEKPFIKISCHQKDNKAIIEIEDNGGGISHDILPKIFEPYFTTKHQTQGTGLGLYSSRKIVTNNLNGKLSATNTPNGAKFIIEI